MSAGGTVRIGAGRARGRLLAPPSKSQAHRLLIGAALAHGTSIIRHLAPSQDILATAECLRALGASISPLDGDTVTVRGIGGMPAACAARQLYCRESGSTLRFLLPLCLLDGTPAALHGSERLLARPQGVYRELCRAQGIAFAQHETHLAVCGRLAAGEFALPGDISSQFITGLLYALPLLRGDSRIVLTTPLQSRPYLDMTLDALRRFGIEAAWDGARVLNVRGGQTYSAIDATVEGDHSNAAFFGALNALGGEVRVDGLCDDSLQGDRIWRTHIAALAAGTPTVSLADCPDLGPVLMAVAAARNGAVFTDTARLRIKESDRGAAMARELYAMGVPVEVEDDRITVRGGMLHAPARVLCGHNDHRIVMALAVLCTVVGGEIGDADAVAKSMPDFFEALQGLGISVCRPERGE